VSLFRAYSIKERDVMERRGFYIGGFKPKD
jgi:hypothetical protein